MKRTVIPYTLDTLKLDLCMCACVWAERDPEVKSVHTQVRPKSRIYEYGWTFPLVLSAYITPCIAHLSEVLKWSNNSLSARRWKKGPKFLVSCEILILIVSGPFAKGNQFRTQSLFCFFSACEKQWQQVGLFDHISHGTEKIPKRTSSSEVWQEATL